MTYCVGLRLDRGLVFAADTRTNAGLDNIATFKKLHVFEKKGDRVITLMTAGNLAVTQSVISLLEEKIREEPNERPTIMTVDTMFQVARLVGETVHEVREIDDESIGANSENFSVSMILGGQIGNERPRLFQIYSAGNFIEASDDTPFFQIGEHKYGKPILDRVTRSDMLLGDAAKLVLISFDSTLRSNLSVGMPIDMLLYNTDTLEVTRQTRIEQDDPYFHALSTGWSDALRDAFSKMDPFDV